MEIETLYMMAKAAAHNAERACQTAGNNTGTLWGYSGYSVYLDEYNRLVPLVIEQFGEEARRLFQPISSVPDHLSGGDIWVKYSELAAARLSTLASYLQSKLGTTDKQIQAILDLINANLRPSIFQDPQREVEIQNALEVMFRARALDYRREKIAIEYSSKKFIPDFTFETLDLALEVKLCNSPDKEKAIVDEINADIPAYQSRYRHIVFVVYDLGFVRDVNQFKSGIESNAGVHVLVIKK